jgi:hypothetical protein
LRTENQLTAELARKVRALLPGADVTKHADFMTAGVPDLSVTLGDRTSWFEAKVIENVLGEPAGVATALVKPRLDVPRLQWHKLTLLRGWLVVYTERGHGLLRVLRELNYSQHYRVALAPMDELAERVARIARGEWP